MTVDAKSDTAVYSGTALEGAALNALEGATITYSVYNAESESWSEYSSTVPSITNSGSLTYKVKAELANYDPAIAEGKLQVNPATMTVDYEDYSGTYDGKAHSATVTPSVTAGTKVEYQLVVAKGEEEAAWSTTIPIITDAGNASYRVKVTNPNYNDVEVFTIKLNVEAKAVTIEAAKAGKTYGESDPEKFADATISTYFNDELDNIDLTVTRPGAGEAENEKAATYTGALTTGLDAKELDKTYPNYSFTVKDADFTIAKKTVTFEANSTSKAWGTNDPEEGFTATVTGLVGEDDISYTVKRDAGERAVTAIASSADDTISYDEYRMYVDLDEKDKDLENYDPELKEGTLTIKKTPVVIESSIDGREQVYSGTIVTLTAVMEGLDDYPDNYAYQWQVGDSEDGPFDIIKGAEERTYKYVLNKHTAGKHYRVVITLKIK